MAHIRKQIRDAVKKAMTDGNIALGKVFTARVLPLAEEDLPAVLIYSNNEESQSDAGRHIIRETELIIELVDKGNEIDDKIDDLAVSVEEIIKESIFPFNILQIDLVSMTKNFTAEGQYEIGSGQLKYTILYRTKENNPQITE
jgi:hypothetical protein